MRAIFDLGIEMRDPDSQRAAWYGSVEQSWTGQEDEAERIATAVRLLLERFPPEGQVERTYDGEDRVREGD